MRWKIELLLAALFTVGGMQPSCPAKEAEIMEVNKIWDQAPYNAFTDLLWFKDRWICTFREAADHSFSPDGALRIITSPDGKSWTSAALMTSPTGDLRDPKITLTPDGRLMLNSAEAFTQPADRKHQSKVWFSSDGKQWTAPVEIGDPNIWMWRVTWHKGLAYGIGYDTVAERFIRLYSSPDGMKFDTLVARLFEEGEPSESSMLFLEDDSCLCLVRRTHTAQLGIAKPPYKEWSWKDLGVLLDAPHMIRLDDGRIVAAGRSVGGRASWTSLLWLDPVAGTLTEFLKLPSRTSTSYPGLVLRDGFLWVSYYSPHEGKSSIYLAKIRIKPKSQ